ncbi:SLC13 family permease [Natronomonas sp. EA1]|uniref:SLC13 family permease n=1 Tax=Natronomonas sp. EA1 TaxID=3421655 RepID=UPI003EB7D6E7
MRPVTHRRRLLATFLASVGLVAVALVPRPVSLTAEGQVTLGVVVFAAFLWTTRGLPLPVTALAIPTLLTALGVYDQLAAALANFADPLIFLFIAGFMLANALSSYDIDRRIALWLLARLGSSPRRLVLAIMVATAFLSMWVSNTATTAMMTPIALGVLAEVIGREALDGDTFSNLQISTLLGTAYAASVGGVATLVGTPPNAVVVAALDRLAGIELSFVDWLAVGLPVTVVTLPFVWYMLVYQLYPPEIDDVSDARARAVDFLEAEGELSPKAWRVAAIFAGTATLWVGGGLGPFLTGVLSPEVHATLFGAGGDRGLLYFPLVGLYAIPALVVSGTMEWDDLVDIDWGTILLFGGGITLADALQRTGAVEWLAGGLFLLTDAPILLVVGAVITFVVFTTEVTSNTATTSVLAPLLVGVGGVLAGTLGVAPAHAAMFLAIAGGVAASFALALPVATPPNAIVFGSGHMSQEHMLRAGIVLNLLLTVVLTLLLTGLFYLVWPVVLW